MFGHKTTSSLSSILEDKPYLRWWQQPKCVLLLTLAFLFVLLFCLPSKISFGETLTDSGKFAVDASFFLCLLLLTALLSNVDIAEKWKNLLALAAVCYSIYLIYAYSAINWDLMRRQFFSWEKLGPSWKVLMDALGVTLRIGFTCFIFVPAIGFTLGLLRSFENPVYNFFISAYVTFFRSIPDTVLIVLVYFALPYIGIKLESVDAVIAALTLLYSAYATEIFRSGILAINRTQKEAAAALGMNSFQTMVLVVMPQAIRVILPPLTSLLVSILKSTSVASIAAAPELMTRARQLMAYTTSATPLLAVSVFYFVIITPFVLLSVRLEKAAQKFKK